MGFDPSSQCSFTKISWNLQRERERRKKNTSDRVSHLIPVSCNFIYFSFIIVHFILYRMPRNCSNAFEWCSGSNKFSASAL